MYVKKIACMSKWNQCLSLSVGQNYEEYLFSSLHFSLWYDFSSEYLLFFLKKKPNIFN